MADKTNPRTPAQSQIEFLLKLKGKELGALSAEAEALGLPAKGNVKETSERNKPAAKQSLVLRTVPLDSNLWRQIQRLLTNGTYKDETAMWRWAMELLAQMPEFQNLSPSEKQEFFSMISAWRPRRKNE